MDSLDIIILAAAGVGLVAFVVLAVLVIRQGRVLRDLEERIGPPVPPAAAPSLERVRAVRAGAVAAGPAAGPGRAPSRPPTARQAEAARAEARRSGRPEAAGAKAPVAAVTGGGEGPTGRGLVVGAIVLVIVGMLGAGGWYFFLRDDAATPSAPVAQSATSTAADSGEVPDDVPPLANKAAYTVAVLNASGVTGAAANKVAPRVQADGYTLGVVDNATRQDVAGSQVQYVKGRREVGWNLAKDLGVDTAVQVSGLAKGRIGTADAVIIVGKDLAG